MIRVHRRGRLVVRSAPPLDLVHATFSDTLLLVFTRQVAIISLVESPALVDGNVFLPELHQRNVGRADTAPQ
jgi:hypothetical protein